jgi:hypothetical protein
MLADNRAQIAIEEVPVVDPRAQDFELPKQGFSGLRSGA